MYNDKAIDKLIENLCENGDCPCHYRLRNNCAEYDDDCFSCWKQALSTEPEG